MAFHKISAFPAKINGARAKDFPKEFLVDAEKRPGSMNGTREVVHGV